MNHSKACRKDQWRLAGIYNQYDGEQCARCMKYIEAAERLHEAEPDRFKSVLRVLVAQGPEKGTPGLE